MSFSSTCVTPGISRHTYPGGEPCVYCHVPKGLFFAYRQACHFRPRVSSRALGRGARRGSACTLGASLGRGRAPWRVLWAFKSRSLAINHEIAFRLARANQAHATPQNAIFNFSPLSTAVLEVPQQPSKARQPRYNSRASSFSLCDSHERRFCAWVRERVWVRVCHCRILQQ